MGPVVLRTGDEPNAQEEKAEEGNANPPLGARLEEEVQREEEYDEVDQSRRDGLSDEEAQGLRAVSREETPALSGCE